MWSSSYFTYSAFVEIIRFISLPPKFRNILPICHPKFIPVPPSHLFWGLHLHAWSCLRAQWCSFHFLCFTLGSFYCYVFKFTNLSAMPNLWFIPSSLFFITHIMFFTSKDLSWVFFVSSGYQLNFFNTWNTVIMNALVFLSAITLTPLRVLGQLQLTRFSPYREFYPASLCDWWFFYWISQIMNFTLLGTVNVGFLLKYSWIRSGK